VNASYDWLRAFVPIELSAAELRDLLTSRCATVEDLVAFRKDLDGVVIGRVVEVNRHPNHPGCRDAIRPHSRRRLQNTVDELSDFFVREITVGIEGTDIKAGVIKVANGNTIDMFGDKLLRAAARASRMTGVPITTHTAGPQRMGEKQAAIFEEEGIAPQRICIGHSDNSPADYQMGLARRGYRIGMDQLPRGGAVAPGTPLVGPGALPWAQRYSQIKSLVDAGFADRVMLGNDDSLAMTIQPTASTAARVAMNPDGMLFVVRKAIPALKQLGISAEPFPNIKRTNALHRHRIVQIAKPDQHGKAFQWQFSLAGETPKLRLALFNRRSGKRSAVKAVRAQDDGLRDRPIV